MASTEKLLEIAYQAGVNDFNDYYDEDDCDSYASFADFFDTVVGNYPELDEVVNAEFESFKTSGSSGAWETDPPENSMSEKLYCEYVKGWEDTANAADAEYSDPF